MARRVVVLGIVAVLVAVIAGGLVIRRDHAQRSPSAPAVTTSPTAVVPKSTNLPAPLDNAIGRLEQDVAN
jgi:hypothetical protein